MCVAWGVIENEDWSITFQLEICRERAFWIIHLVKSRKDFWFSSLNITPKCIAKPSHCCNYNMWKALVPEGTLRMSHCRINTTATKIEADCILTLYYSKASLCFVQPFFQLVSCLLLIQMQVLINIGFMYLVLRCVSFSVVYLSNCFINANIKIGFNFQSTQWLKFLIGHFSRIWLFLHGQLKKS